MSKVQIYTTSTCPYCHAAKALLTKKNIDFHEINVENPIVRQKMVERANGRRTVPQIFFGDIHIGGFDDLSELALNNEIEPLLEKMNAKID